MTTDSNSMTLEKAFFTCDLCDWPDIIEVFVSSALRRNIDQAASIIAENSHITSIDLVTPDEFFSDDTESALQSACRYDVSKIVVDTYNDFYFYIQGKWDSRVQAEYVLQQEP